MARALAYLPWPIRLAVTLPVAGLLLWTQYTAISGQRSFEAWRQGEERAEVPRAPAQQVALDTTDVHYIGEQASEDDGLGVWAVVAGGGAGLTVLVGCLALFSFFAPLKELDAPPELEGNRLV